MSKDSRNSNNREDEFREDMNEYLSDPFNCVNVLVASTMSLMVPIIGANQALAILSGYVGSILASLTDALEKDEVFEILDEMNAQLKMEIGSRYEGIDLANADKDTDLN